MIDYCQTVTAQIIITGCFWTNSKKEIIILKTALKQRVKYVPIDWIAKRDDVYPHIGEMIEDTKGKQYPLTSEFVLTHPNDKGMYLIAEAIYKVINN